jgi:hypothetical protein
MRHDHGDPRAADSSNARWRKSRRSGAQANCVEVAFLDIDLVAVRDSKAPDGPVLIFASSQFDALVAAVKRGIG